MVHYCVENTPGEVGRTSTFALCTVTLPWVMHLARRGVAAAARDLPPLAAAINIHQGRLTNAAVAESFGMPFEELRA